MTPLLTILLSATLSLSAPAQPASAQQNNTAPSPPSARVIPPPETTNTWSEPTTFPWSGQAPADVTRNALTPHLILNEHPSLWRPLLRALYAPSIRHCRSAREAVLRIASTITAATGIQYSTERRTHCMNPLEALREEKVSCTGNSIFLACALRSISIPARAVGIRTWNHIPGNHTWVEAWFDGDWHMIEANEHNFNTPWVLEYISMIDPSQPEQRIYAAQTDPTGQHFPIGRPYANPVPATDVTDRYLALAQEHATRHGLPPNTQRLLIDIQPRPQHPHTIELLDQHGNIIATAPLPTASDDIRRLTPLHLPRSGRHTLRYHGTTHPVTPTPNATQIIRLSFKEQGS